MLKYQVRARTASLLSPSSSSSLHDTTLTSRSSSMVSLNSMDSASSGDGDWGTLKVYTNNVRACTDYKTLRLNTQTTCSQVIESVLNKFKLSCRDSNLFELWMEVTTKASGCPVRSVLRLTKDARPLELQRCHPLNMSRFILNMKPGGTLVRIHDHNICPESNYKSLMLAPETSSTEAISLVLSICRRESTDGATSYGLFLTAPDGEAQIPEDVSIVQIARRCLPQHKIVIRPVDSL